MEKLTEEEFKRMETIYKLFGSVPRLKILLRLNSGECEAGELAVVAGISQSAASHQLKDLKQNRIIKSRKVGLNVLYSLDDHHIIEIIESTEAHIKHTERGE